MIKMSINSAKRLGFVVKGYDFNNKKKSPTPIIAKSSKNKKIKKNKSKTKTIPLKKEGILYRLDF